MITQGCQFMSVKAPDFCLSDFDDFPSCSGWHKFHLNVGLHFSCHAVLCKSSNSSNNWNSYQRKDVFKWNLTWPEPKQRRWKPEKLIGRGSEKNWKSVVSLKKCNKWKSSYLLKNWHPVLIL